MAALKIFVSSTCYDLTHVRGQLRDFLISTGHEPVMSDFSDVVYDPKEHTHTSCIHEVSNCDFVILIIGSRFGGAAVPEALNEVDLGNLQNLSTRSQILESTSNISITQLEILRAIELGLPIYAFVYEKLWNDYDVYLKNRQNNLADKISYPSIEKQETAKYIFGFLEFITHRARDNAIKPFSRFEDVREYLIKQWSGLFQRLLRARRDKEIEAAQIESISEQIEGLKELLIRNMSDSSSKEVARGVLRYRFLLRFVQGLNIDGNIDLAKDQEHLKDIFNRLGITTIKQLQRSEISRITLLIRNDDTFFEVRFSRSVVMRFMTEWTSFTDLPTKSRSVILEALSEEGRSIMSDVRHVEKKYYEVYPELLQSDLGMETEKPALEGGVFN